MTEIEKLFELLEKKQKILNNIENNRNRLREIDDEVDRLLININTHVSNMLTHDNCLVSNKILFFEIDKNDLTPTVRMTDRLTGWTITMTLTAGDLYLIERFCEDAKEIIANQDKLKGTIK